jgi:hypothetical protein
VGAPERTRDQVRHLPQQVRQRRSLVHDGRRGRGDRQRWGEPSELGE